MHASIYSDVPVISDEAFNSFADVKPVVVDIACGICVECKIPMNLIASDYNCPTCGLVQENSAPNATRDVNGNTSVKISVGGRKGRVYNVTTDYSKTQKKQVLDLLIHNNNMYTGFKFSRDILTKVATAYNSVQKSSTSVQMPDGKITLKKFVRRGNIKGEILAALVYYECIRAGATRKKKDIALMMRLPSGGFSSGETILRMLYHQGKIDIPIDSHPVEDYLDRYLEALNIENTTYREFILEIVNHSISIHLGLNSQISSKIVGVLWIVISHCGLNISAAALEQAADGIKKSTFTRFSKIIESNSTMFIHIYQKHGVPLAAISTKKRK